MRRTASWKLVSATAIAAIGISGLVAAPAQAAEGDPAQAQGELLSADLLSGDLAGAAFSYASDPGGPAIDSDPLTVELLDGDIELITGGLQLPLITDGTTPGLLDLGQAGLLSSYAATPDTDSAIAASGLLGADGALAFDENDQPASASTASVDLTALLGADVVTDGIVDELALQIGALASRAESNGETITDEYRVADLQLQVQSELVGDLSTDLRTSIDALETPLQTTLQGIAGTDGALTEILSALDLDLGLATASLGDASVAITVADLSSAVDTALGGAGAILVSDDQSVTIDLTTGSITVDVAQLLNPDGTGLNDLDPNTDLLTPETIGLLTEGVSNALGKIVTPLTNALAQVLDDTTVSIDIPIELSILLGAIDVASGTISISGSIQEIVAGDAETDVDLALLGGTIPIGQLVEAVTDDLLPQILSPLGTALDEILSATAAQATTAITEVIADTLDVLSPVLDDVLSEVVTITVNAQPTLLGQPADIDEPGAFTVRALELTLLPNLGTSSLATIGLASSTVLAQADVPTIITDPEGPVNQGDEITISGSGFSCGPVTVSIFDGASTTPLATLGPFELTPAGTFSVTYQVPPTIEATTLRIVATTPTGCDEGDDTEIVVVDPPRIVATPDPVDEGTDLTITGTGFTCSPVDVVITDEDGAELETFEDVAVADGGFTVTYPVPAGLDPQTLTVTATGVGTCEDSDETTVDVEDGPEVITDPEGPVTEGDVVTISGSGFDCGPVTVTITNGTTVVQTFPNLPVTQPGGTFSVTWTVPAGLDPATLTITATGPAGCGEDDTEIEIVDPPSITAGPSPVDNGEDLTITGADFTCGPVTVTITDAEGTIATLGPFSLTDGGFTTTWEVPATVDPGTITITATTPASCDEGDTTTVLVTAPPAIDVTPNPAAPGTTLEVDGTGFDCGPVDVQIIAGDGTTVLATVEDLPITGDSTFSTTIVLPLGVTDDEVTVVATSTGVCGDTASEEVTVDAEAVSLTVNPTVAQGGQTVQLTGANWSDASSVSIQAVGPNGANLGQPFTATPNDGVFTVPYVVSPNVALGDITFTATQNDDSDTATLTVVRIPAGPATIVVSPSTVEPGATVAIDGEGFDPTAGTVAITIRTPQGGVVGTVLAFVRPDGALSTAAFTLPGDIAPQQLTATAVQGPRTASDAFDVRAANLPVIRLAGPERFQTAVEISRDAFPFGADIVYLANAVKFPDALSAAPAAAQSDSPLLLTRLEYLEPSVMAELDRLDPDLVVIVGDTNSVSATVAAQVGAYTDEVVRLGGADRFETSQLIADFAFNGADTAYVATGFNFPDALTAGAAAGADGAPLLLTYGPTPAPGLIDTLDDLGVDGVYIAGDDASVAVSQEAVFEDAGIEVLDRYAGVDGFGEGLPVAQALVGSPAARVYVATGVRFPDALAGSAIAGSQNVPVFVSRPGCLSQGILDEVDRLGDPQIVLLGDELALDRNVFDLVECAS